VLMQMRHDHPQMQLTHMLPYGAIVHDGGVQFVVFSRDATKVRLLLYSNVNDLEPEEVIHFDPTDRGNFITFKLPARTILLRDFGSIPRLD